MKVKPEVLKDVFNLCPTTELTTTEFTLNLRRKNHAGAWFDLMRLHSDEEQ